MPCTFSYSAEIQARRREQDKRRQAEARKAALGRLEAEGRKAGYSVASRKTDDGYEVKMTAPGQSKPAATAKITGSGDIALDVLDGRGGLRDFDRRLGSVLSRTDYADPNLCAAEHIHLHEGGAA